ncbi:MAG TPA: hypothetical protein DEP69_06185 [Acidimicrobiaceae bacterium]|nr:hypothetical protein [Acidimicrobiaceae bacterium]
MCSSRMPRAHSASSCSRRDESFSSYGVSVARSWHASHNDCGPVLWTACQTLVSTTAAVAAWIVRLRSIGSDQSPGK